MEELATATDMEELATVADIEELTKAADMEELATVANTEELTTAADMEELATGANTEELTTATDMEELATATDMEELATVADTEKLTTAADMEQNTVAEEHHDTASEAKTEPPRCIRRITRPCPIPECKGAHFKNMWNHIFQTHKSKGNYTGKVSCVCLAALQSHSCFPTFTLRQGATPLHGAKQTTSTYHTLQKHQDGRRATRSQYVQHCFGLEKMQAIDSWTRTIWRGNTELAKA